MGLGGGNSNFGFGGGGSSSILKVRKHAYTVDPLFVAQDYCGTAPYYNGQTPPTDDQPVFTIIRITVFPDGSTLQLQATNVNWTDYLTHIYS